VISRNRSQTRNELLRAANLRKAFKSAPSSKACRWRCEREVVGLWSNGAGKTTCFYMIVDCAADAGRST